MKIILNHVNWWIFSMCIIAIDFLIDLSRGTVVVKDTIIISTILTIVITTSYLITKNSSSGLYVTPSGFTWKRNGKDFYYPWENLRLNVLVSFNSFVLIELTNESNPKCRLIISCLVQKKGLEQMEIYCPKTNILYRYLKKYSKT